MNEKKLIDKLFKKLINNSISKKEYKTLLEYIKLNPSCPILNDLIIEHLEGEQEFNTRLEKFNQKQSALLFQNILNKIETEEHLTKNSRLIKLKSSPLFRVAAVLVLAFSLFYFLQDESINTSTPLPVMSDSIATDQKEITITLDNGNVETIKEDDAIQIMNAKGNVIGNQNGSTLTYINNIQVTETLSYNTLKVPYGKLFDLILSDGTTVKLNAGSSIKYPVKFIAGLNREVFLEGEAFFDVTTDTENPFIVNMNEIGIRVLGTKFNASSYPEDDQINTVLVEGSINIYKTKNAKTQNTATLLKPNQIASWSKTDKNIVIQETDVDIHTAWINGRIRFRHLTFAKIVKKLERKYDVEIVNNNEALNEEMFTASFDIEPIEEVLKVFQNNYGLSYTINDKLIIIN